MQEQKPCQPAGGQSSFPADAIIGHRFAALARPIIAAPVSRGHVDVLACAERSRRRLSAGFPADAQMPKCPLRGHFGNPAPR